MGNKFIRLSQLSQITGIKRHTLNARIKILLDGDVNRTKSNNYLLTPNQARSISSDSIESLKGKIVYIGNLKGGVGKTTLSYLLSETASHIGIKTCIIDLDVQSNLTRQYLDNVGTEQPVFYDVVDDKFPIEKVLVDLSDTLSIIPSSLKNTLIQKTLSSQSPKHHLHWFNSLCLDFLRSRYELIIVDTPPHLTTLNSVFCLCLDEHDNIVIPVGAEDFSMMGVEMFLDDVFEIRKSYDVQHKIPISIIVNRFFQTQKHNLEMLVKMGQEYGDMLSETIIRDNVKIREFVNKKIRLDSLRQGKEVYQIISNLLQEFGILKTFGE